MAAPSIDQGMQIGLYHESAGTKHAGGVAVFVRRMAVELANSHEVRLYTKRGKRAALLEDSGVTVIETPAFDERALRTVERVTPLTVQNVDKLVMTLWARRNGVLDHANSNDVMFTFGLVDDLLLSNLLDVPVVSSYHCLTSAGIGGAVRKRLSRADHVLANSADTASRLDAELGIESDGIVSPGVDLDAFHPRATPTLDHDEFVVLFVGRIVETKGVYDLLEAFSLLDVDARLCVVGEGDRDGVKARARDLGIDHRVDIEGEVAHLSLPGYYTSADVFCLPSYSESFGMVVLEAMACETPVVTTDLDAIRTYVTDGREGLLVPAEDPEAIADRLRKLAVNPERRRTMGRSGRQRALDFGWGRQAAHFERFCADVLDEYTVTAEPWLIQQ